MKNNLFFPCFQGLHRILRVDNEEEGEQADEVRSLFSRTTTTVALICYSTLYSTIVQTVR